MDRLYVPDSAKRKDATVTNSITDQDEDLLKEHAEEVESEPTPVVTAFLVFQDESGMWVGSSDINIDIVPQRIATLYDIYAGAVSIADDVSANKTAQHVSAMMMAQAKAMQDQMQNQQLLSKLQNSGVFKR